MGSQDSHHYFFAKVAQLVEHDLAKVRVAGSNPVFRSNAVIAQLVEHVPSKYGVAGSNPVYRSNFTYMFLDLRIYVYANGYK